MPRANPLGPPGEDPPAPLTSEYALLPPKHDQPSHQREGGANMPVQIERGETLADHLQGPALEG